MCAQILSNFSGTLSCKDLVGLQERQLEKQAQLMEHAVWLVYEDAKAAMPMANLSVSGKAFATAGGDREAQTYGEVSHADGCRGKRALPRVVHLTSLVGLL